MIMAKQHIEPPIIIPKMTLTGYLKDHSRSHNLDKVIIGWFQKIDKMNPQKTKIEWDGIISTFFSTAAR